ncbi:MAG: class I SAM-dependent methyltransferase [Candidatus Hydrothermarchaeales archaeon]
MDFARDVKRFNISLHKEEAKIYDVVRREEIFNKFEQRRQWGKLLNVASECLSTKHCLDLGCGTGNLIVKEAMLFDYVIGLDISREMINVLKGKIRGMMRKKSDFIVADCENLPFRSNVFDLVSISSVLHHLPSVYVALKEAYRVLLAHGVIFMDHEPNAMARKAIFKLLKGLLIRIKLLTKFSSRDPDTIYAFRLFRSLDHTKTDVLGESGFHPKAIKRMLHHIGFYPVTIDFHFILFSELSMLPKPLDQISMIDNLLDATPLIKKMADTITIISKKEGSS